MPRPRFHLGRIGTREKTWILLWVLVVLGVVYSRWIHWPRTREIREKNQQIEAKEHEKIRLEAKLPNVPERQAQIVALKKQIIAVYEDLSEAEKKLLDVEDVDRLLERLVKDKGRFEMALNSIRPLEQKKASGGEEVRQDQAASSEPYRKLHVQLDAYATFQGLLQYVDFLESMSPYQRVEQVKVKVEGKEFSRPHLVLLITVLVGEAREKAKSGRQEIFGLVEEMASRTGKDPFLTGERPKETAPAAGLVLSGIFSEEGRPVAAMINNEIYRVGDLIDQKRVVAIEANRVLLEQGNRQFVLAAGQGGEINP